MQQYNSVSKFLHWLVVFLVVIEFLIAWTMPGLRFIDHPTILISYHFSFGVAILLVMIIRLLWRLLHPAPPTLIGTPIWQNLIAHATHYLLYLLLIVTPLVGWTWASARGWDINLFGFIPIPPIVPAGSEQGMIAGTLHKTFATLILFLIALHMGAALFHKFILKDSIMQRMLRSPNV